MIIKRLAHVPSTDMAGHGDISKQIVIGPDDESKEIVLRYFKVAPGGSSPYHDHDFPHLVKVEIGEGAVIDPEGNEHPVGPGDYVYVPNNEIRCFKNTHTGRESLEFICIVPGRGEG
jgi:quercetin dioxygenase-like cupin family protein